MITKLKIMLPYFNDEYVVGEYVHLIAQATDENPERIKQFGKVTEIIDCSVETESTCVQCYRIKFESEKEILFEGAPVQIEYGSVGGSMKVWAIFSIENEYDQPENNLVKLYKEKPTVDQLNDWWDGYVDDKYDKQELLRQLVSGTSVRFNPFGTCYRIKELEVAERN